MGKRGFTKRSLEIPQDALGNLIMTFSGLVEELTKLLHNMRDVRMSSRKVQQTTNQTTIHMMSK